MFAFFIGVSSYEFLNMASKDHKPNRFLGILGGLMIFVGFGQLLYSRFSEFNVLLIALLVFVATALIEMFGTKQKPIANISLTWMSALYPAIPFVSLFFIGFYPNFEADLYYHPQNILGFFFLMWTNDTGAYLTGRKFGKHKLFERVSPKKTWEGFIGGLVLSLIVGYITSHYFDFLSTIDWLITAGIVSCFGTMGDLVESRFKRSAEIKDSGTILPGHGGILDRFDGVLIAAPIVLIYLLLSSTINLL